MASQRATTASIGSDASAARRQAEIATDTSAGTSGGNAGTLRSSTSSRVSSGLKGMCCCARIHFLCVDNPLATITSRWWTLDKVQWRLKDKGNSYPGKATEL